MGDLTDIKASGTTRIVGDDEQYSADVTLDKDLIKKLWVKSSIVTSPLGNLFFLHAMNGASSSLNVNGSGTPVEFLINAEVAADLVVDSLLFETFDGKIKIDKMLGKNSPLSNGIIIEIKSEDTLFQFLPITKTQEFDSYFAFGPGRSYELVSASGNDSMVARFGPANPFRITKQGTYASDDYIKVIIQDNLNNIANLQFLAEGSREI